MSTVAPHLRGLSAFRGITKELQKRKLEKSESYNYLLAKFKSNQITGAKYCREQSAAIHDATTYLSLLQSSRAYEELCKKYHGESKDAVKQAAARVGLELPKEYMEENQNKLFTEENSDR